MTDKEDIIKALKCLCGIALKCRECPYSPRYQFPLCQQQVAKEALDLINRQQAEIKRLKIENQSLRMAANSYKLHYNEAKSEAVKEFADRLKALYTDNKTYDRPNPHTSLIYLFSNVEAVKNEMVGDTNDT